MLKKIKKSISKVKISSKIISYIAIIISIISLYFQFFHINHELFYTSLYPVVNSKNETIEIPVLFKNTGNQIETIIDVELLLEVRDSSESFFKRISNFNGFEKNNSILNPNESFKLNISGNYKRYLIGTYEIKLEIKDKKQLTLNNKSTLKPIKEFKDLSLILKTSYLTEQGILASENREIGKVSFTDNGKIKIINCDPIELKKIDLNNDDTEITGYSIIPNIEVIEKYDL